MFLDINGFSPLGMIVERFEAVIGALIILVTLNDANTYVQWLPSFRDFIHPG
jgi:hypothetical protein